ncbi:MAG: acetate kinase [Acidobacteriaceae bacterium]|nr:acetate kinase [Acidobacteriaceae bacterium]
MNVLVLNAGSSSLKYQLIATSPEQIERDGDERLSHGVIENPGPDALDRVIQSTEGAGQVDAVGHRVVHGGERFSESTLITNEVFSAIERLSDLAPLHNPASVKGIREARSFFGQEKPQVAVFDTAFHCTIPRHASLYAVPYEWYEKYGVRRYGFHGTSHRYIAHRYRVLTNRTREQTNIISLHLGNGCSACAIRSGKSVDTSMGLTPLEGLVMGTRAGDIDPSVIPFISSREHVLAEEVEKLLNTKSGLLGLSSISGDMRRLSERADDEQAQLAIEMFCYRARKYIGAYLAAMGGADAIVFTGGIGENSAAVRARICDGLQFAGLTIDPNRNEARAPADRQISTDASTLAAYCIHTDEELLIARDTVRVILGLPHPS